MWVYFDYILWIDIIWYEKVSQKHLLILINREGLIWVSRMFPDQCD
jgi:hypothetical protein